MFLCLHIGGDLVIYDIFLYTYIIYIDRLGKRRRSDFNKGWALPKII